MTIPPLSYDPIVAGSVFAPLPVQFQAADGTPLDMTGAGATVRIVDARTHEVIVESRAATIQTPATLGRADFHLLPEDFATFTVTTTWLVQWTLISPLGTIAIEPAKAILLPVMAPI